MTPLAKVALIVTICSVAGLAFAHGGVKNPAVMARMTGMTDAAEATKILGDMARGKTAFDTNRAQVAKSDLIAALSEIPNLFASPEADPKSEALPTIWSDTTTFQTLTDGSVKAAQNIDTASAASIAAGMAALGTSCSACHKVFRLEQ
jgi:cytochrome c556